MTSIYDGEMLNAYRAARNSDDPSTQTGAVLIGGKITEFVWGWNHFPVGVDAKYWHGEKADKYARVVHAETGVLLEAARQGVSTLGATMVAPWAACSNCAKHISDAGIKRLVRHSYDDSGVSRESHWYQDVLIGDEIMTEAGVEIIEIAPLNFGIELRREGKIILV